MLLPNRLPLPAAGCAALVLIPAAVTPAPAQESIKTEFSTVQVETVADGLNHPWALVFLPDGTSLVTERPGRLRLIDEEGKLGGPISGVPKVIASEQGGLFDVALDPKFSQNRLVYLSYFEAGDGGNGVAVARGRLSDDLKSLENTQVIFRAEPKTDDDKNIGSRLVFDPDGTLFVTVGDRFSHMEQAQELDSDLGKVVRINADGSIPKDNPFAGRKGARPEIWSYGHRNPQAAALDPQTDKLWIVEHGPRGGDEINIPEAGKNYGWPLASYGVHYSGQPVGKGTGKAPGTEQPIHHWTPSIAPSGMAFYTADLFPKWKGDLFVGALKAKELVRLDVSETAVNGEEAIKLGHRIRDVRQGPDGALYLLTDEADGKVLRLVPKS